MFPESDFDSEKIHKSIIELDKSQRESLINQDAATKTNA